MERKKMKIHGSFSKIGVTVASLLPVQASAFVFGTSFWSLDHAVVQAVALSTRDSQY